MVTRVSRGTLNTEDSLDWLFTEDGVSETVSNVGELLCVGPLNLILGALVIPVANCGAVVKLLLEVQFLSLGEPGACWLSPSVVVLEELILQVVVIALRVVNLIEALGDVGLIFKVFGANLSNVKINEISVVAIQFPKFVTFETGGVDVVVGVDVLVRNDVLG